MQSQPLVTITPCKSESDYGRVRDFLRTLFILNQHQPRAWPLARLDYWRWHVQQCVPQPPFTETLLLVAENDGPLIAALCPDEWGEAYFHVDPRRCSPQLEATLIDIAEARLARVHADGQRALTLWAHADDAPRRRMYTQRGYTRGEWPEQQWVCTLDRAFAAPTVAAGYTVRALGDASELPARSWASWRAFHPDAPDADYAGHAWYARNILRNPLYRPDLDLVAAAADGTIAGFTTLWYDDVTRTGMFEPVGVAPEHQRRGLARALMLEGMRRLQALGATHAMVSGYSEEANHLYGAVTGVKALTQERWHKTWPAPV